MQKQLLSGDIPGGYLGTYVRYVTLLTVASMRY